MVLLCMIFLHLVDDYKMQGILAEMKQKGWWEKNCPDKKYSKDYMVALVEHGFMNSFMIHIPIYLFLNRDIILIGLTMMVATLAHAIIDDLKANKRRINLIQDQIFHIVTIFVLYFIY